MNIDNRRFRSVMLAVLVGVLVAGCAQKPEEFVASAKDLLAKNDQPAAIIQLRNALQKKPDLAEARFLLGKSLLETGDVLGAEKELNKAAEFGYPQDQVSPMLARVLVARGEFKKAVDEFGSVKLASPESMADLQVSLGKARLGLGDADGALASFEAALSTQPDYPPALIGMARIKASKGELPAALSLVETALAKSPNLTEGWQLKGDLLTAQQQTDAALLAYRKALETKPDFVPAHYAIVTLLMRNNKGDEAKKALESMKQVAPRHPQTSYLQALMAVNDKDYAAAREAIQRHLKSAPDSLPGTLVAAQIEYQLGSYVQAENALVAVLQRAPGHVYARRLLAQTYLREGKPGKARETLLPLLAGNPDSDTLTLAGQVFLQNGDAVKAAGYFEKAVALDPKNTGKRTAVALAHIAKGDSERGVEELEGVAADDAGIRAELALIATSLRERKFDAALAAVAAIEKKQPDKPLPHVLRGDVLVAKGDFAGARKSYDRALAIDSSYLPAVAGLARLDLIAKKPDDAKKRFEAFLQKDPKNVQALLVVANLRAQSGASADEVASLIGKAVAANPNDTEARLALIRHWLRSKEPKKAVAAAQDAVAALPERPEILDAAGMAYRAAGDSNQALQMYVKLAQLRPESPTPYMRMAEIHVAAKDNSAALDSLRKALAIKPDLIEAQRAMVALDARSGNTTEAVAAARAVQKQRPTEAIGYILEGNVHASRKAWAEAAAAYRSGLKQSPTTDLALYLYATLVDGGKPKEAESFATGWLKDHPKDRGFRFFLAQRAVAKKDYASAARQYKAVLEVDPDDAMALNNLAWVASQMKDPKAMEYAERALKLAPDNPAFIDTLGMLQVNKGDTARGIETLQRALTIAPNVPSIRLNLARALIKSGQKDAAKKELETLAKLGDKFGDQAEVTKLMQSL